MVYFLLGLSGAADVGGSGSVRHVLLLAVLVAGMVGASAAYGPCERGRVRVDAADVNGEAVAIDGDVAVVGAGRRPGVAYVYRLIDGRWVEERVLTSTDGYGQFFGRSVSISGGVIVVGDSFAGPMASAGTAYVFRYGAGRWNQEARLVPYDLDFDDTFGISVGVSGDVAVVGADRDDDNGYESGSAYVFRFDGLRWIQTGKLVASDGAADDGFGYAVAIDGDVIVVGSPRHDVTGADSGAAYVFERSGDAWVERGRLTASDGGAGDLFGYSVSVSGESVLVGAFKHDSTDIETGAVYVFNRQSGAWVQRQMLTASDAEAGDWFGVSVSLRDDVAVVGASLDNGQAGTYSGSVYVFEFDGFEWVETSRLTPSAAWSVSHFGSSVGISGGHVVVGADDRHGVIGASAYTFDLTGDDCDGDGMCDDRNVGGYVFQAGSFRYSPVGSGVEHEFTLASPPEAVGDVIVSLTATSDLDHSNEWIDVRLEGVQVGSVFGETGRLCASPPDYAEITFGADLFNALRSDATVFTLVPSAGVNVPACSSASAAGVTVRYETKPAGDCNASGMLDVCDVSMGFSDDVDGDGVPDECGPCVTNADCSNGNVCRFVQCVADACHTRPSGYGDLVGLGGTCGPDGLVDLHDILAVVDAFAGRFAAGCSSINADVAGMGSSCRSDGVVDLIDVLAVLGAFSGNDPCCGTEQ